VTKWKWNWVPGNNLRYIQGLKNPTLDANLLGKREYTNSHSRHQHRPPLRQIGPSQNNRKKIWGLINYEPKTSFLGE